MGQVISPHAKSINCARVVAYQNNLIVIGGYGTNDRKIADVNILDTTSNKWITIEPLPNTNNHHRTCLIGDTLYLVRQLTKEVFRAHVPSLISGTSSGVWKSVANVPFCVSRLPSPSATSSWLWGVVIMCEGVTVSQASICTIPPKTSGHNVVTFPRNCIILVFAVNYLEHCIYLVV